MIDAGWMPVDAVVVDGRPGLLWRRMADVSFTEPFFQQTVDRVRSENPGQTERFTEFDALLQLDQEVPRVEPTGFIFHSSRCGSTLLANACRSLTNSIVLSEANAIDKLVARFITDADDVVKESIYSVFLRAVVNTLAQHNNDNDQPRVFIKFSCCSVSQLERIRRIWPRVPRVFLYRDPVETIVSNVSDPPAWLLDEDHRILAHITGASPAEVAEMSLEERCARSIGSFFTTAHTLANDNSMLLNYKQLSVPVICDVLRFFGVSSTAADVEAITNRSRLYSKHPRGSPFVSDTDVKQKNASQLVREMAQRWANEPYALLELKRS